MKNQALFSSKNKSNKLKCRLLQFLFGTLRIKYCLVFKEWQETMPKGTPMFLSCKKDAK